MQPSSSYPRDAHPPSPARRRVPVYLLLLAGALGPLACADDPGATAEDGPWSPILQAERQRPLTDRVFERTPERLARGERLAKGLLWCMDCHSPQDTLQPGNPPVEGLEFSGRIHRDDETGRLVAPNLTPDEETGIGRWTDDMLARAIREGVGHDGRGIGGPMSWQNYRDLTDEDLASVVVYLRSLPPIRNDLPDRRLTAEAEQERAREAEPLTEPVTVGTFTESWQRGQYLVELGRCMACHTAWRGEPNPGLGAGGDRLVTREDSVLYSPNITPHATGIGGWSRDDFRWVMRTGKGGALHPRMPWTSYRHLTDAQLDAIYDVLQRMYPVAHVVGNHAPPTLCQVCGQVHGLGSANPAPAPMVGEPLDAERAEDYVGRYRDEAEGRILEVLRVDEELHVRFNPGEPPVPLLWRRDDTFMVTEGWPSPARFERDSEGRVTAFVMVEVGERRAVRMSDGA